MTEKQIKKIIETQGWIYHPHHKGKNKRLYIYASRRNGDKVEEKYIIVALKTEDSYQGTSH